MTGIRMIRFASRLLFKAWFQHNEIKHNVKFLK